MNNRIRNSENRIRNFDEEKWTARDMAYRPGGLPDWSAAGFGQAKREWQGLTTAERKALWNTTKKPSEFAELIEAKLRAKNGFA